MNKDSQVKPQSDTQIAPVQDSGDIGWGEPVVGPPLEFDSEQEAQDFLNELVRSGSKGNTFVPRATRPEDTDNKN